ncbi:MAG: ribosome recycling factor [Thermotogae bacterium]|nr:ribosome recycling factor [Thermotogota bacterium]
MREVIFLRNKILKAMENDMKKSVEITKDELMRIRTGRASPFLLENIKVEYYGNPTPISQVAAVNVQGGRTLVIKPWDNTVIKDIEKAILQSNLGITPQSDGNVIRLVFPSLTVERRKQLTNVVKEVVEKGRIAVRNIRREYINKARERERSGEISEDDRYRLEDDVQKVTDKFIEELDKISEGKEKEIMEF